MLAIVLAGCRTHEIELPPPPSDAAADASTADAAADASIRDAAVRDAAPPPPAAPGPPPELPTSPALDDELTHRLTHFLEAVLAGNVELCHDVRLPRKAYVEDVDSTDSGRLWDKTLDAPFRKNLDKQHRRLKDRKLKLLALDVPHAPKLGGAAHKDGWRSPIALVENAKLRAVTDEGKDVSFTFRSMVHWRGAWYIERW